MAQIQLRATTLRTYDGCTIYIPNQELFNASITNNTVETVRRNSITVGIGYDADIRQAQQIIRDAVLQIEGVETNPPPEIFVWELGASAVQLQVRIRVNSRRLSFLETSSQAAIAIKEALQRADIEMPTEVYTVKLKTPSVTGDTVCIPVSNSLSSQRDINHFT